MMLLHCAAVPAQLPGSVIARWLARLRSARAATLAGELEAGRGLDNLTGLALLDGCARMLDPPRSLARLTRGPGGKPRWVEGPDFSIAHAAGLAACAVAPPGIAVGVDLERGDGVDLESLRLVTSAAERERVRAGAISAAALWTCKEAVLKAAGIGVGAAGQVEIAGAVGHHAGRVYHLVQLDVGGNLRLAIATTAPIAPPEIAWPEVSRLFDDPPATGNCRSTA